MFRTTIPESDIICPQSSGWQRESERKEGATIKTNILLQVTGRLLTPLTHRSSMVSVQGFCAIVDVLAGICDLEDVIPNPYDMNEDSLGWVAK